MEPRISAVTLAVQDLARSRRFYDALGWQAGFAADDIAFYQAGGVVLILWEAKAFTDETRLPAKPGGICLAHNVRDPAAVDRVIEEARKAGARVVQATKREWGGVSGHFADPDGHLWEVAWNPHWRTDADGRTLL